MNDHKKLCFTWAVLFFCFLLAFIMFLTVFFLSWCDSKREQQKFAELTKLTVEEEMNSQTNVLEISTKEETSIIDKQEHFSALYARNHDFIGWLSIEGTDLNYPVMCTPDDPEYYLLRDFDGERSNHGVPFFGEGCDIASDNILVYGHNMKDGTMFSTLINYSDRAYFENHPTISFDTLNESREYEVIAVFQERVHAQSEIGIFRYYTYGGVLTKEQFESYVAEIQRLSLYDTGSTAVYGEQLLTLSTCAYHTQEGRFVVVAKRTCGE